MTAGSAFPPAAASPEVGAIIAALEQRYAEVEGHWRACPQAPEANQKIATGRCLAIAKRVAGFTPDGAPEAAVEAESYASPGSHSSDATAIREAIGDAIAVANTSNPEWRGLLLESITAALPDTDVPPQVDNAQPTTGRDQGLTVEIEDGRLVISIGIDALMIAVEGSPIWENAQVEERGWTITDPDGFAHDIRAELEGEEEDGTTLIHVAIDAAIELALEGGSLNIDLGKDG